MRGSYDSVRDAPYFPSPYDRDCSPEVADYSFSRKEESQQTISPDSLFSQEFSPVLRTHNRIFASFPRPYDEKKLARDSIQSIMKFVAGQDVRHKRSVTSKKPYLDAKASSPLPTRPIRQPQPFESCRSFNDIGQPRLKHHSNAIESRQSQSSLNSSLTELEQKLMSYVQSSEQIVKSYDRSPYASKKRQMRPRRVTTPLKSQYSPHFSEIDQFIQSKSPARVPYIDLASLSQLPKDSTSSSQVLMRSKTNRSASLEAPRLRLDYVCEGHRNSVTALLFCEGLLWTGSQDYSIKTWRLPGYAENSYRSSSGASLHSTLPKQKRGVLALDAVEDTLICSGSADCLIKV